jgi:LysM repeat protein
MHKRKRCTQCGAWFSRRLRLCPICGHEDAVVSLEDSCDVCGASLPAGQRICLYCGAVRQAPILGLLPFVGRMATSLAILALGAVLIWWILPLGLATSDLPSTDQRGGTPTMASYTVVEPQQEYASTTSAAVAQIVGQPTMDLTRGSEGAPGPAAETVAATATATATLEPATSEPPPAIADTTHAVVQGDYPGKIASLYGVSLASLLEANGLTQSSILQIGDALVIPAPPAATAVAPAPR